jgi:hypothetical protein
MRVSLVFSLLVGGMLALAACSTSVDPRTMTVAERTEQCRNMIRAKIIPTGRQTGDARHDYECTSIHARPDMPNVVSGASARSTATDRALRGGN